MAYSTTPHDVYRGTSGIALNPEQSREVWANATQQSVIMQLAQRVTLPGPGLTIDVITGDIEASWIAESTEKHVTANTFSSKTMKPYKLAAIMLFSNEFRRDKAALYEEIVRRAPAAIGKKFDETVFAGVTPGTGFDVLTAATQVGLGANVYDQLVAAKEAVATGGGSLNAWAISPQGESILLGAKDGDSRPLFLPDINAQSAVTRIFGAPVVMSKNVYATGTPNVVGVAGDWSQMRYGIVEGIRVDISDEATINDGTNQINLWQRNMFAVRVEAEVGCVVKSTGAFVLLTDEVESA